ncbi:MAG TPA: hypothetical protein VGR87_02505 [Candidatus Limnocylindria bacterium]|jgi:hypothetical protein|nr:hypothetical protein [Candidatus Limnocylindria bacterium]
MAGFRLGRRGIRRAVVGAVLTLVVTACSDWTTQHPSDFSSLDVPSDWQVSADSTGRIDAASPAEKGERVVIQPFFTTEALTAQGAEAALDAISSRLMPGVDWDTPMPQDESTWRMTGSADGQDLVAILTYAASATGSAGTVFVAVAPSGHLAQDAEALSRIMESLKLWGPPSANARRDIEYTSWPPPNDPQLVAATQGAFSVEVPKDLGVTGGMSLEGSTTQWWVEVHNTARDIGVEIGNKGFPIFQKPNVFLPSDRSGIVRPYAAGARFITQIYGPETLTDFAVNEAWDLPNIAALEPVVRGFNRADAGMVDFTFTKNGRSLHGGALAVTEEVITGGTQLWDVKEVIVWYGTDETFDTATAVMAHMWATFRPNPEWVRRYQQTVFAQSKIWSQTAQDVSRIIAGTFANIDTAANELRRRRGNATLGVVDVRAADGRSFKVDNRWDHYWLSSDGTIFGTTTSVPPCLNCPELLRKP